MLFLCLDNLLIMVWVKRFFFPIQINITIRAFLDYYGQRIHKFDEYFSINTFEKSQGFSLISLLVSEIQGRSLD